MLKRIILELFHLQQIEHDKFHILKHISKDVKLTDVTEDYCCLGLFGPKAEK